jgi:orotidine-5'-phosphate decarboxylase
VSFAERLDAAVRAVESPCLLGLDPHLDLLPEPFALARDPQRPRAERARALADFCRRLIDLARGQVAAVKPQSAFFELLGADGAQAWEKVVAHARAAGLLVIGDVKRGDTASTADAYARAYLEGEAATRCDAITVQPWLGSDTLEPFVEACDRSGGGIYALVRTSNPGSDAIQRHGSPPLWERVAAELERLGSSRIGPSGYSPLGAVVGATKRAELARVRERMPHAPFLLPGYGAQGASAADVVDAFPDAAHPFRGALVASSRAIAFAYRQGEHAGRPWEEAARRALSAMNDELRDALARRARG